MVVIRGPCVRNLKTVAYILVVITCAYSVSLLLSSVCKYKSDVPTQQLPGIESFNAKSERVKGEDGTMAKISEKDHRVIENQVRRKERVEQVCEELRRNSSSRTMLNINRAFIIPKKFHPIYVDDKHRLLYCEVPKVACTNWKRVLLTLTGKVKSTEMDNLVDDDIHRLLGSVHLKRLDRYSVKEIQFRLNNYYKFMFVREPFERLLSAYRDKLASPENKEFHRLYGRDIIRRFRRKPSMTSLQRGHDVTFEEFIRYLLDPKTTRREKFEPHWRPYHQLCDPCNVAYDFIGKYETLDDDADFVLRHLVVSHLVSFPKTKLPRRSRTSKELVAKQFANISRNDVRRLWEIYSLDFNLFEYKYPEYKETTG